MAEAVHKNFLRSSETIDVCVVILAIVLHNLHELAYPLPRWSSLFLGGVLLIIGLWGILKTHKDLKEKKQEPQPGFVTNTLVTDGLFAISRNPLYVSNLILYGAASLLFDSLWPLLLIPVAMIALYFWLIRPEENYLLDKFGPNYTDYCNAVPRWVGRNPFRHL